MFISPIAEKGLWFFNPATAYKITSLGICGKRLWNRIIYDRKKKLETYSVDELIQVCAKSHRINVYVHMCNVELQELFERKRKATIEKKYQIVLLFSKVNIPVDIARYLCIKFIPVT